MTRRSPLVIPGGKFIHLLDPTVRSMMNNPGFYVAADTARPGLEVPLVSVEGKIYSLQVDDAIDPRRFVPTLATMGPFSHGIPHLDLVAHLRRQRSFSEKTFGPGERAAAVLDHIRKELAEIEADPTDIMEWIDVVILALDGAWRAGYEPHEIAEALLAKQAKNESRKWPDWRTADPEKAIEHDRSGEGGAP